MSFSYLYKQIVLNSYLSGEGDVWVDDPTENGIVLYSFIVPAISLFAIFGNIICFMVLRQKELAKSVYTYLAVLAANDVLNGVYLFFSGISRGILWEHGWSVYDALIGLPVGGVLCCLSILATVAVTVDRVICIWNPLSFRKRFCRPVLARKIVLICIIIAIAFNIPSCFIFEINNDDFMIPTAFFDSTYYNVHNWIKFTIFGVISGVILIGGNIFLILTFRKVSAVRSKEFMISRKGTCAMDNKKLNITLIMLILVFLISGIPAQLVSRSVAISILFNGDHERVNSKSLELIRQICTLISVICLSTNFVLFYLFCPSFTRAMQKMFKRRKKKKNRNLQVNVFFLNDARGKCQNGFFIQSNCLRSQDFYMEDKRKTISTFSLNSDREFLRSHPKNFLMYNTWLQ